MQTDPNCGKTEANEHCLQSQYAKKRQTRIAGCRSNK